MKLVVQLMRYGHQDFFHITGRDPVRQPLTVLERDIIGKLLEEQVVAEFTPREDSIATND